MKKFKLRENRSKKYFEVVVHDSLQEMRKAASKYDIDAGKDGDHTETYGVFHPFEKFYVDSTGKEIYHNQIGIVRFSKKHLSSEIVSHEIGHAAMWQYRLEHDKQAIFGEQIDDREENLIHIYGRLFRKITNQLYKHNLWK